MSWRRRLTDSPICPGSSKDERWLAKPEVARSNRAQGTVVVAQTAERRTVAPEVSVQARSTTPREVVQPAEHRSHRPELVVQLHPSRPKCRYHGTWRSLASAPASEAGSHKFKPCRSDQATVVERDSISGFEPEGEGSNPSGGAHRGRGSQELPLRQRERSARLRPQLRCPSLGGEGTFRSTSTGRAPRCYRGRWTFESSCRSRWGLRLGTQGWLAPSPCRVRIPESSR